MSVLASCLLLLTNTLCCCSVAATVAAEDDIIIIGNTTRTRRASAPPSSAGRRLRAVTRNLPEQDEQNSVLDPQTQGRNLIIGEPAQPDADINPNRPIFLFSGQSNMEGHTYGAMSIEGSKGNMFQDLLKIIKDYEDDPDMDDLDHLESKLFERIHVLPPNTEEEWKAFTHEWKEAAETEANELIELYKIGLLDNINSKQHPLATCSLYRKPKRARLLEYNYDHGGDHHLDHDRRELTYCPTCPYRPKEIPLSSTSKCGYTYGPELMFEHVLGQKYYNHNWNDYSTPIEQPVAEASTARTSIWNDMMSSSAAIAATTTTTETSSSLQPSSPTNQNKFHISKVAVGGTEIYKDWFPGVGKYWPDLNFTIHSSIGKWQGFAWYQGENDCFSFQSQTDPSTGNYIGEDTSYTYLSNLTAFVDIVRQEIVDSPSGQHFNNDPTQVPVAIFQIGSWPGGDRGDRIREAQSTFVSRDSRSILIPTSDLAKFYHFDAPSQLIMGSRLANQWIDNGFMFDDERFDSQHETGDGS